MDFERTKSLLGSSPIDAIYAYLTGNTTNGGTSQRKLDMSMRYVEHVLGMYSHLPVVEALPKVVDALFAYTAIDSILRAALTGHVASTDGKQGVSYETAYLVRERVHGSLKTHLAWRRDTRGEAILSDLELDDVVVQFTRTVRDVFSRSLREGAAILADPTTREQVAKRCLSVLAVD